MDLHIKDKVFIVSGGAKGIGKAICLQLLEDGAVPVLLDKDETAGNEFVKKNTRSQFIALDLNDASACHKAVEDTNRRFGHIDGVVNNAGMNDGIGLEKGDPKKFIQSLTSNAG